MGDGRWAVGMGERGVWVREGGECLGWCLASRPSVLGAREVGEGGDS